MDMKKTDTIRQAFKSCGYTQSVEELMLFGEFETGVKPLTRITFGANSTLSEEEFLEAVDKLPALSWGKIWLIDETFFFFDGHDWEHIDCKVPEDIDPFRTFLS